LRSHDCDSDDWVDSELEEEIDEAGEADIPDAEGFRCARRVTRRMDGFFVTFELNTVRYPTRYPLYLLDSS
jgi:hypothetical protein